MARYAVYYLHPTKKRACGNGISTDDLDKAKKYADIQKNNRLGKNVLVWVKVRDTEKGKYVYTAEFSEVTNA